MNSTLQRFGSGVAVTTAVFSAIGTLAALAAAGKPGRDLAPVQTAAFAQGER